MSEYKMQPEAKARREAAYRMFCEGKSKSEIATILGVSSERARQLVNHGFRIALKEGWATAKAY